MDERDEVVTEFDQTNGKAPGLEGDGRDVDRDGVVDPDLDENGQPRSVVTAVIDEVDEAFGGRRDDERRD